MSRSFRRYRGSFGSLLLASASLIAATVAIDHAAAQSLPWPDANPVMRLDSPAKRAHRPRQHRVKREAKGETVAQTHKAEPTRPKPVADDSNPATPDAVPLPTVRGSTNAAVGSDGASPVAVGSGASASSDGKVKSKDGAPAAAAAGGPAPEKNATSDTSGVPAVPAVSDVPVPAKAPASPDTSDGSSKAKSSAGANGSVAKPESDASGQSSSGGGTKSGSDSGSGAATTGEDSVPAPKPGEGAAAAVARSGLDAPKGAAGSSVPGQALPDTAPQPAGAAAGDVPLAEIPLPEKRPEPPAGVAAPAASAEGDAKDDAPNSTAKLKSREPDITPAAMVVAAAAVEDAKACEKELKARGVDFTVGDSISEGECGVLRPVELKTLSSGVSITPSTFLLCRAALALDMWMSDSVVPEAKAEFPDDRLVKFRHASTYVCRPRASEAGISEHARGSAIDIGGFGFSSGREIGVKTQEDGSPEAKFQRAVREAACGPFKTVLGPGTDPDHATHFHLDIAARRNGATYCK